MTASLIDAVAATSNCIAIATPFLTPFLAGEEDKSHHGPAPNKLYSAAHNMKTSLVPTGGAGGQRASRLRQASETMEMGLSNLGTDETKTSAGYKDQMKKKAFDLIARRLEPQSPRFGRRTGPRSSSPTFATSATICAKIRYCCCGLRHPGGRGSARAPSTPSDTELMLPVLPKPTVIGPRNGG